MQVPGRGHSGCLATSSGDGRGRGAVRGRGVGRGNRGSPREGPTQPRAGRVQKKACSSLGCLRLLKHTYSHTLGTATPTHGCTKLTGVGSGGLSPAPEVSGQDLAPTIPCDRLNTIHFTPSDLDTPTASCAVLGTGIQSHSRNYPLPQTIYSSLTPALESDSQLLYGLHTVDDWHTMRLIKITFYQASILCQSLQLSFMVNTITPILWLGLTEAYVKELA